MVPEVVPAFDLELVRKIGRMVVQTAGRAGAQMTGLVVAQTIRLVLCWQFEHCLVDLCCSSFQVGLLPYGTNCCPSVLEQSDRLARASIARLVCSPVWFAQTVALLVAQTVALLVAQTVAPSVAQTVPRFATLGHWAVQPRQSCSLVKQCLVVARCC